MAGPDADLVHQTIWINAAPQVVFKLVSDPGRIREWLVEVPRHLGDAAQTNSHSRIQIVEQVRNERVVLVWPAGGVSHHLLPETVIELKLRPHDGGTLVHLRQFLAADEVCLDRMDDRVKSLALWIECALRRPLPAPPRAEHAIATLLFLEPRNGEGSLAYARRRVASATGATSVAGAIAAMNLMLVGDGPSDWRADVGLTFLALSFVLANVFIHTAAGVCLRDAGRLWRICPLAVSAVVVLLSCYGFFWLATGQLHGGRNRADSWLILAAAVLVAVVLYARWFDGEVERRGAWRPVGIKSSLPCWASVWLSLVALCCCCATARAADIGAVPATRISELATQKYSPDEPGAAVLVAKAGQVILGQGYGLSNLEHKTLITVDTPFCIASVTKPLTATAILMLVEQGKLRLDDQVIDLLPDYPRHASGITIAHLLSHTAGIANVSRLPQWRDNQRIDLTVPQILQHFEALPLNFPPGERWEYSNSGYLLLGAILEKETGKRYDEFMREEVFARAGMQNSRYGNHREVIPNRAAGYQLTADGYVNAEYVSMTRPYSAGGLMSTVNDLFSFTSALTAGRLLQKETLECAFAPSTLNSGEPTSYGQGWMVGTFRGHRVVQHAGGMPGYSAQMWLLPDEEVFAVLLSNAPDKTDQHLIGRMVAIVLGETSNERAVVHLDERELKKYVGRYQLSSFGNEVIAISFAGGKLTMHVPPNPVCELHATAPGKFFVNEQDIQITFILDSDGRVPRLVLHHGALDMPARRLEE